MFKIIESPTMSEIQSVIQFLTARNMSAIDIHQQVFKFWTRCNVQRKGCGNENKNLRMAKKLLMTNFAQADHQLSRTVWFLLLMQKSKKTEDPQKSELYWSQH